eukprot:CAMPEP_0182558334 /NCGR_PEP_ID=MMETSP1324-20130603/1913_1 /TAXON_ID=236786 /ORGANISM="Florenciella sp., Strain RCC1587" /LENGTH=166 /DNA_ID=CAMNT_0024770501 /DNA_START=180 /DNA_END=676 /DNA_ORIENTATION=-
MSGGEDEGEDHLDDQDTKRKKRLELNRKAAQESRKRKKIRIEELQRSVVFLTRENNELREQNELLRQMLSSDVPQDSSQQMGRFQAESASLKLALCQQIQAMAQNGGGGMDGGRRSMDGSGGPGRDMNEMMMRHVAAAGGNATNLAMLANQSAQGLMHLARGVGPG